MGFWGIEVKAGKTHPYHSDNVLGKLHVTQATLGLGSSKEKSILQCSVGHKNPIFLCSLLPNKIESCSLDLEFDEDDLVAFSVIGERSIHLSGYFEAYDGDHLRDEYDTDSYGEDVADTESDESSEFGTEDEYGDDFIDDEDDDDLFLHSPVRNSGVVIEEIMDDEKPTNENGQSKKLKKKDQSHQSEKQIVVRGGASIPVLESEDEDGFPISNKSRRNSQKLETKENETPDKKTSEELKKPEENAENGTSKKRKDKSADQDDQQERKKKKKKKQKDKGEAGKFNEASTANETNDLSEEANQHELKSDNKVCESDANGTPGESQSEKKKKQKKKKKKAQEKGDKTAEQTVSPAGDKKENTSSTEKMQSASKSKSRTYPNGLVVEELAMGKPDGKRASPGKQVSVQYIGKLQKNGKIFDSNVGRAPFKFRLGIGQVIKGWDVGVNGMRVGDKRRLTIPPSMGYGTQGAGGKIPPNAWLMFDVELKDVR